MIKKFWIPDNFNRRSVIFFAGILLFWYSPIVITGLTENRFFYSSCVLLDNLRPNLTETAMFYFLTVILLILTLGTFCRKWFPWLHTALKYDFFTSLATRAFIESHKSLGDYYTFFSPIIPDKLLQFYSENTIGLAYSVIFYVGLGVMYWWGFEIIEKLKKAEKMEISERSEKL